MKVVLEKVTKPEDEGAHIRAVKLTEEVRNAVDLLENNCRSIPVTPVQDGRSSGESYMLGTNLIYYTESIDKRTYVYTKEACYETRYRLYELEDTLNAELLNGEKIVISRSYVKDLKRKLGV